MAGFLSSLLDILPGATLRLYREEIDRLRAENHMLLDRLMYITTGIGPDGKPAVPQSQPTPEPETKSAYDWLQEQEAQTRDLMEQEFLRAEARGFTPPPPTPPEGGISDPMKPNGHTSTASDDH